MDLWHSWISLLGAALAGLSTGLGLSEALSIVVLTLLARGLLMPISLGAALRAELRKRKLAAIRLELQALGERMKGDRAALGAATLALYRKHDIRFLDRLTLSNAGAQSVFGIGLFQAIGHAGFGSRFLWIPSLAKPDLWLSLLVALLVLPAMAVMPGAISEPAAVAVLVTAVLVAAVTIAFMPAAVGLSWAASGVVSLVQAVLVRGIVARSARAGS